MEAEKYILIRTINQTTLVEKLGIYNNIWIFFTYIIKRFINEKTVIR